MTRETIQWLNDNVLVGFIDDRTKWASQSFAIASTNADGDYQMKPWFAQDGYTGGFEGPVPLDAVANLFSWDAIERPIYIDVPCGVHEADSIDADGNPSKRVQIDNRKAIVRDDNGFVMNISADGYRVHQYQQWLVDNVSTIIDDDVQIDSAMLLMGGGVAAVSVSLPETVTTSADFAIRPRILAFTSHNGKHATTYQRAVNAPVCDNSLDVEIRGADDDQRIRIKHTSGSVHRIGDAREALRILHQDADEMVAFFDQLACWEIENRDFAKVLNLLEPMPDEKVDAGKVTNKRALTMADDRRTSIAQMYLSDGRAAPWRGTALGVLQAFNTFDQQVRSVNGERLERQMLGTFSGAVGKYDRAVLDALGTVTDRDVRDLVGAN